MKNCILAAALLLTAVLTASCSGSAQAQEAAQPVEVGQSYAFFLGQVALRFKILEIGKGGLVKVEAAEDARFIRISAGSRWWLNLNQALLVEALK